MRTLLQNATIIITKCVILQNVAEQPGLTATGVQRVFVTCNILYAVICWWFLKGTIR